jgi:hypothetical protein
VNKGLEAEPVEICCSSGYIKGLVQISKYSQAGARFVNQAKAGLEVNREPW